MSDIPLSQEAPPIVERGEPVGHPLGPETLVLASHMAATMLPGLIANATSELDEEQAVQLAVRTAIGIVNESRAYRLVDNKAVKQKEPNV